MSQALTFDRWWRNGGSRLVYAKAIDNGWRGAAEQAYLAGLLASAAIGPDPAVEAYGIARDIARQLGYDTVSEALFDLRKRIAASVEVSQPAVLEAPVCDHRNSFAAYDHVKCQGCGSVVTDGGWGIASRKRFKSLAEAEFYKKNGRFPDEVMA